MTHAKEDWTKNYIMIDLMLIKVILFISGSQSVRTSIVFGLLITFIDGIKRINLLSAFMDSYGLSLVLISGINCLIGSGL